MVLQHCNLRNSLKSAQLQWAEKITSLNHCYLHGIVTCAYFLGPENGVRFLRRFSFRCGIGCIFVALFVKSSFGTFLLWSCTSQGMRHFQTSIAIDDNTSWSQHWGVLRFAVALFGMCEVCTEAVHSVFEHELHHRFGHVWSMYRSSPFRSTLNTSYITGLDMWKVCTEAVHSVELWTRATSQVWTCGKYVPKQSIPQIFEHELHHRFGHV